MNIIPKPCRWAVGLMALCHAFLLVAQTALPRAHSHNDYEQKRPLLDALAQGFCSVEADIWLVDGQLLVAHDRDKVKPDRTLQALYLDPLRERVRTNAGAVHPGGPGFTLLIDLKSEAEATYRVLRDVLAGYQVMLTRFTPTNTTPGAVTVILSGSRPTAMVATEPSRWCGIDGRMSDLAANPSPHLVPLVSDAWRTHFAWFQEGRLAEADISKLRALTAQAHQQGRRIRFWGVQDQPFAWREQLNAGVDYINTDRLAELAAFLREQPGTKP